jgi:ketosteroid isomerase-like protein
LIIRSGSSDPHLLGEAMSNLITGIAVILFAASCVLAQSQQDSKSRESADTTELSRLEAVWNDAHVRGDVDALDGLWADDLTVAVPNMPVMTKENAIGIARSARLKFKRYQTSDIRIRLYGDAAVVTGQVERTRELNGRDVEDKWRFTKVYIRHAGRWQVVAWHASTVEQ